LAVSEQYYEKETARRNNPRDTATKSFAANEPEVPRR
jgi:hypothetical protein